MSGQMKERLYNLLPAVYRARDIEEGQPLRALLSIIEDEMEALEEDINGLYNDWFIETCSEWLIPYIGDLVGIHGFHPLSVTGGGTRSYVANTLAYRRRRGTTAVAERVARDVTGWSVHVKEFYQLLAVTQQINHLRLDDVQTANLRDSNAMDQVGGPFETSMHNVDVRQNVSWAGKYNIPNFGVFLWRLQSYPLSGVNAGRVAEVENAYTFDPLGMDIPLFNRPHTVEQIGSICQEINVSGALRRRALEEEIRSIRGALAEDGSFEPQYFDPRTPVLGIVVDQTRINPEEMLVCDLSEWRVVPSQFEYLKDNGETEIFQIKAAVDPALGRLMLTGPASEVYVDYSYGFSGDVGAGPYDRSAYINEFMSQDDVGVWVVSRKVLVLDDLESAANRIAVTAEGGLALSASLDGTLKLWRLGEDGAVEDLATIEGHTGSANAVALDAGGSLAVSGSSDRTVRIWDLSDLTHILQICSLDAARGGHSDSVNAVALTPDGLRLISGSSDRTIKIWNISNLNSIPSPVTLTGHTDRINAIAVTPDSKFAVSASGDNRLMIWDLVNGRLAVGPGGQSLILTGHTQSVNGVAVYSVVATDGSASYRAVSVSSDRTLKIWDVKTGGLLLTLPIAGQEDMGHEDRINDVAVYSVDEGGETRHLAISASSDQTLRIWDLDRGKILGVLDGHSGHDAAVSAVACTPSGSVALSASEDNIIKVWDLRSCLSISEAVRRWKESDTSAGLIMISDSQTYPENVFVEMEKGSKLMIAAARRRGDDTSIARELRPVLQGNLDVVSDAVGNVDLPGLIIDGLLVDGQVTVRDGNLGSLTLSHSSVVPGAGGILVEGENGNLKLSLDRSICGGIILSPTVPFLSISESIVDGDEGKAVVGMGAAAQIECSTVIGKISLRVLESSNSLLVGVPTLTPRCLGTTPDGSHAISAFSDHSIRVWDLISADGLIDLEDPSGNINAVAMTADGTHLVCASSGGVITIWDLTDGESRSFEEYYRCPNYLCPGENFPCPAWLCSGSNYLCPGCDYVYDPDVGDPDSGVDPGTLFEDLPLTWTCPTCGLSKSVFQACQYVYHPDIGDPDHGVAPGTPFSEVPEDWACPICGEQKSEFEICGFVYDPEAGDPDHGIAPGTSFEDLPLTWTCPTCGSAKDEFSSCDYVYDPHAGDPAGGIAPGTPFEDLPESWTCPLCGAEKGEFLQCQYVYDPDIGDPDQGVAPGTPFVDIPDTWTCPLCGAARANFRPAPVNDLAVYQEITSEETRTLAVSASYYALKLWDLGTGEVLQNMPLPDTTMSANKVAVYSFSEGSAVSYRAIAACSDHNLRIWDLDTGEQVTDGVGEPLVLSGHHDRINDLLVTPDGRVAISASADATILIWNLNNEDDDDGWIIKRLDGESGGHTGSVNSISLAHDVLVSASSDRSLKAWILGRVCKECDYIYNPIRGDPVYGLEAGVFFEDLDDLWTCPICGAAKSQFELTGPLSEPYTIPLHSACVSGLAAYKNLENKYLAAISVDGQSSIEIWDLISGKISGSLSGCEVSVVQKQTGCLRFCYLPIDSNAKRRYRCQPDLALAERVEELNLKSIKYLKDSERYRILNRVRPIFETMKFGRPQYAQLSRICAPEILSGARDGSEMGVFGILMQPQRSANLKASLQEYKPFGLVERINYVN